MNARTGHPDGAFSPYRRFTIKCANRLDTPRRLAVLMKLRDGAEVPQIAQRLAIPEDRARDLLRTGMDYCVRRWIDRQHSVQHRRALAWTLGWRLLLVIAASMFVIT